MVLARTPLDDGFATPDCPRWQVSGSGDLERLGDRIWDTTWRHRNDAMAPSHEDVELVAEILTGRGLPQRDVAALAADREEEARRLTLERRTCSR